LLLKTRFEDGEKKRVTDLQGFGERILAGIAEKAAEHAVRNNGKEKSKRP
jgi:hypothetical protein